MNSTVLIFAPGGFVERQDVSYAVAAALAEGPKPTVVRYPLNDLPGAVRYARSAAEGRRGAQAIGFSAGGVLTQILAVEGRVRRAVAVGAPSHLADFTIALIPGWWKQVGASSEQRRRFSPLNRITADKSPLLLIHSLDDTMVPIQHARAMEKAAGARLITGHWGQHGAYFERAARRGARWLGESKGGAGAWPSGC